MKTLAERSLIGLSILAAAVLAANAACSGKFNCPEHRNTEQQRVAKVLRRLHQKTDSIKTYQASVLYIFEQPLLESRTVRKGKLYYTSRLEPSRIRINFETLKQDEGPVQKHREDFIFDGVWLVRINYQLAQAQFYQKAPKDQPISCLDLAGEHLPLIGFGGDNRLNEDFDVSLDPTACADVNDLSGLHLKVKPGSRYAEKYQEFDVRLDKKTSLAERIVARTAENEVYEVRLLQSKLNKRLPDGIFSVEIPENFSTKREPLSKPEATNKKG